MENHVILVNEKDEVLGTMEKIQAHEEALLHRAFSVFVFNSKGQLLLQQRAGHKYHSPFLWSNTCCSHPMPGEDTLDAANRRMMEEMGMKVNLKEEFHFIYKAPFSNGLTEHELDHVFVGYSDMLPNINREEVADYRYIDPVKLSKQMKSTPGRYTEWFKICFEEVISRHGLNLEVA